MKRWIHASSSTTNTPNTKDGWISYFQNNYFREYPDYDGLDDLADYLDGKESDTDWSYALEDYGADPEVVAALEKFVVKKLNGSTRMKRWVHAADEPLSKDRLVYTIADECILRLMDEDAIEVKGSKTRESYILHALDDGTYGIELEDENSIIFNNIKEVAEWLVEN